MIDTHCHLTDRRLFEQLDAVLSRAEAAGVRRMITIGTEIEDDGKAIHLCQGRPNIRCAVGIHPNHVTEADRERVTVLRELEQAGSVVALGEMGLDYHYDRAPRGLQRELFEAQLAIATDTRRPVIIHCRQAVDDALAILGDFADVPAVFHCFTGTPEEADRIFTAGYLIGFTGPVTFKKNDPLREAARRVPLSQLLVETDAPYLSPEPLRKQKINEPSLVIHTARVIAGIKQISFEELDHHTTVNAKRFFNWQ